MHNHNVCFVVIAVLLTETTVIVAEGNIIQLTTSTSDDTASQPQPSHIQGIVLYSMDYSCFYMAVICRLKCNTGTTATYFESAGRYTECCHRTV